ncbi:hypothetical protein MI302_10725 [Thermus sp. NEB1569]|uniref:Uncharacterized protein n=1 Tax=Thermus scotoductus TaxID=37636 RepID=A0A430RQE4_THESC|nr:MULTISPECIES: hypothetical protein [Thermus]RTH21358.1 hypothetical protein CSW41_00510 [Thermus scotoductus]ULR40559.1 hypothetical protein MI302_10725 [Thermus sp. NEB1569]
MRALAWLLGLGTFALGLSLALWSLDQAFRLAPLTREACVPGPLPERAELWSNGVVEIPLCRRARVGLVLEGTLAQGKGPNALVVEGSHVLWQGEVRGVMEVWVRTTGKGTLALAFTNDFYQPPEDRNLFLRALRVER